MGPRPWAPGGWEALQQLLCLTVCDFHGKYSLEAGLVRLFPMDSGVLKAMPPLLVPIGPLKTFALSHHAQTFPVLIG